jgi:hypothetical protein
VTLRLEVDAPPRKLEGGSASPLGNATIIINGRVIGGPEHTLSAANFALLDAKGNAYLPVRAVSHARAPGGAQEVELTYLPPAGGGQASRLVYHDRRTMIVEVPFTLRNVPLR